MDKYTNLFKALSDETRLRILHILMVAKKELCACEFTDVLEVTTYNISELEGVLNVETSYKQKESVVLFDTTKTRIKDVEKAVDETGYTVSEYV